MSGALARAMERIDPGFSEALKAAREIREWTDGPEPAQARVHSLARAICEAEKAKGA